MSKSIWSTAYSSCISKAMTNVTAILMVFRLMRNQSENAQQPIPTRIMKIYSFRCMESWNFRRNYVCIFRSARNVFFFSCNKLRVLYFLKRDILYWTKLFWSIGVFFSLKINKFSKSFNFQCFYANIILYINNMEKNDFIISLDEYFFFSPLIFIR